MHDQTNLCLLSLGLFADMTDANTTSWPSVLETRVDEVEEEEVEEEEEEEGEGRISLASHDSNPRERNAERTERK